MPNDIKSSKNPLRVRKHLSANTLFHFTSSKDNLISILRNNFRPHYSLERFPGASKDVKNLRRGIPMVCFCDIPLSQIRNHSRDYGSYAIGLSKSWAEEKRIGPVFYLPRNSQTEDILKSMLLDLQSHSDDHIIYLSMFLKEYEGMLKRPNKPDRKVRFYDEREWRYVPHFDQHCNQNTSIVLNDKDFKNDEILKQANAAIAKFYPLVFEPKYIRYIIVEKESEILGMRTAILDIKSKYPENDRLLLTTRLLSIEQIVDDF